MAIGTALCCRDQQTGRTTYWGTPVVWARAVAQVCRGGEILVSEELVSKLRNEGYADQLDREVVILARGSVQAAPLPPNPQLLLGIHLNRLNPPLPIPCLACLEP